jgi:sigma-B regulation protein RsbU (phosphoserine phosphatase)
LSYLNDQLARAYTRDGTFVTAFYAVLDPTARMLTYARAGHNPPRLVRRGDVLSLDQTGALPLGVYEGQNYEEASISLERDDLLLLFTDGITEAEAPANSEQSGSQFGKARLDQVLLGCSNKSTDECIGEIRQAVSEFCAGTPPTDDQTLIAIRCG